MVRSASRRRVPSMRLLLVSRPTDYGTAVCVRLLAQAAVKDGMDVTVACPADGSLPKWAVDAGAKWVELPLRRAPAIGDAIAIVRLRRLFRNADVVHLHASKAGAVGRLAAATMWGNRPRVLFTPHGWSWLAGGPLRPAYVMFERRMRKHASIIAVSHAEAEDGRRVLGIRTTIRVIENGVSIDEFSPGRPPALRRSEPLVLVVGRLSHQKGQDVALRVLAALPNRDVRMRFVGSGDATTLRAQAKQLGIDGRVEWVGEADPTPHYAAADVVLVPSRYDGLSLALLEALSSGNAIVATDVAGVAPFHECLRAVPCGDVKGAAAAVMELLQDRTERDRLGVLARETIVANYSLDRYLAEWSHSWRVPTAPEVSHSRNRVYHG